MAVVSKTDDIDVAGKLPNNISPPKSSAATTSHLYSDMHISVI